MHRPLDRDVNWMSPVQGKSPPVQVKEPYSNFDMVTCRLSSCNPECTSTPADNTRKRVWQYIEKERKERHNAVMPVRLKPASRWSQVKHSTTEPLRSLNSTCDDPLMYTIGSPILIVSVFMGKSIRIQRVNLCVRQFSNQSNWR